MSYLDEPKNPLQCLKPNLNLWFDKDTHTYYRHQKPVGSVTQVLKAVGMIGDGINFISEDYLWRGACIHKGVELINKGKLDWLTVREEIISHLKAYEEFILATGFVAHLIEYPLFDQVIGIAGMLDMEGVFPSGIRAIVDIKSGTIQPWAKIQLAGYDYLLQSESPTSAPRERYALELKGGKPKIIRFREPERDRGVFLSAVSVFNWIKNTGGYNGHRKSAV